MDENKGNIDKVLEELKSHHHRVECILASSQKNCPECGAAMPGSHMRGCIYQPDAPPIDPLRGTGRTTRMLRRVCDLLNERDYRVLVICPDGNIAADLCRLCVDMASAMGFQIHKQDGRSFGTTSGPWVEFCDESQINYTPWHAIFRDHACFER